MYEPRGQRAHANADWHPRSRAETNAMDVASAQLLQSAAYQAVLRDAADQSPDAFVLAHSKKRDWPLAAMAEQLACRKKFAAKLPQFIDRDVILSSEMFEQSSSQWCAQHKVKLCPEGPLRILDICGGLGVDAMALAAAGHRVSFNDIDALKSELCAWNMQQMGLQCEAISNLAAADLLATVAEQSFDVICADPSRRTGQGKRLFKLEDCEPNIVALLPDLRRCARYVLLKLAPSISAQSLLESLPGLERLQHVSLDGEMKECLAWVDLAKTSNAAPRREAVCLRRDGQDRSITATADVAAINVAAGLSAGAYLYDPDVAVVQAQALGAVAQDFQLQLLSASHSQLRQANAALFVADTLHSTFPGRLFRVEAVQAYNRKQNRKYLKSNGLHKVHVWRCQSKRSVANLRQELGLEDGNDASVLVYRDATGREFFVHCSRVAT